VALKGSNSLTKLPIGVKAFVNLLGVGVVGPFDVIIKPFSC
jgi:hypothetical protein